MKIGFIGTDIGQQFIEAFLTAQTFLPSEIMIHDQDKQKADSITTQYPGVFATRHRRELVQEVACFFSFIRSDEYPAALAEIEQVAQPTQVGIFHTNAYTLSDLESKLSCKVAKIIPQTTSIASNMCEYVTGSRMIDKERMWLQQLLSTIRKPFSSELSTN